MNPTVIATTGAAAVILVGGLALADRADKIEVEKTYQDTYFAEKGEYEQKLKQDGKEVHVYDGPQGKGYQVIEETETEIISVGFGPEAADRTWTKQKPLPPQPSATST